MLTYKRTLVRKASKFSGPVGSPAVVTDSWHDPGQVRVRENLSWS